MYDFGDWAEQATWDELAKRKYHVILFNPPFLPTRDAIRSGYENVSVGMLYTNDTEGLEHYQCVLPQLPSY